MHLSIINKLIKRVARHITITLQLSNRGIFYPQGKIKYLLVRVDKFVFSANFIITYFMDHEDSITLLGKSFIATGRTLIDVEKREFSMRVNSQ